MDPILDLLPAALFSQLRAGQENRWRQTVKANATRVFAALMLALAGLGWIASEPRAVQHAGAADALPNIDHAAMQHIRPTPVAGGEIFMRAQR